MALHDDPTLPPLRTPEAKTARAGLRTIIVVILLLGTCMTILTLAGCSQRFLTVEQDKEIHEKCKATGCTMVPTPVWREIQQYFRGLVPQQPEQQS